MKRQKQETRQGTYEHEQINTEPVPNTATGLAFYGQIGTNTSAKTIS